MGGAAGPTRLPFLGGDGEVLLDPGEPVSSVDQVAFGIPVLPGFLRATDLPGAHRAGAVPLSKPIAPVDSTYHNPL